MRVEGTSLVTFWGTWHRVTALMTSRDLSGRSNGSGWGNNTNRLNLQAQPDCFGAQAELSWFNSLSLFLVLSLWLPYFLLSRSRTRFTLLDLQRAPWSCIANAVEWGKESFLHCVIVFVLWTIPLVCRFDVLVMWLFLLSLYKKTGESNSREKQIRLKTIDLKWKSTRQEK